MNRFWALSLVGALVLAGCDDSVSPRDVSPPAAPRGFYSVTGDGKAYLHWLDNTESDLAGYRVYESPCATGPNCPYTFIGSTQGTTFTADGMVNGVTRHFAVAATDRAGNESDLSYQDVFDTPRPEGFDQTLANFVNTAAGSGWDFSIYAARDYDDPATDMFFGYNGSTYQMFVPDFATEIQDAGYASTLDAVDFAPNGGWSPTGTVELIVGHCYIVWTRDDHYAKFRVTQLSASQVRFDWAYQVDAGNPELVVARVGGEKGSSGSGGRAAVAKSAGHRTIVWTR
jgi:hypothetical protein